MTILVLLAAWAVARHARADTAVVPVNLQVSLLVKVADYDRSLPGRQQGVVRVLVVRRAGVPDSAAAAARALNALSAVATIAGLPHEDVAVDFTDPAALAAICRSQAISILYMSPGLGEVEEAVSQALAGTPVLSVAASAEGASKGMVLGFDLVGGKPKLVVNLTASRRQTVSLQSELLRIARVIE